MRRALHLSTVVAFVGAVACTGTSVDRADAAISDAGPVDAGHADAGPVDGGGHDAGPAPDGGVAWMPPAQILDARSLAWTDAELLDDPAFAGALRPMLEAMCPSVPPGTFLSRWLHAFASTAHSERAGPALLADTFAAEHGADPQQWPLESLPFRVTGVHNRLDLHDGTHCGEFRVSVASSHPIYRPLHFIFLFRMDGDCVALARRFADLSGVDAPTFAQAARALVLEHVTPERFLLAESVEFTVSPWEWRQWRVGGGADGCDLQNPPLFQQVDPATVNTAGADRDAFLAWVEANAAGLASRTVEIPAAFRRPNRRVNQGVPWIPLDLSGLPAPVLQAHPALRQQVELVGCAACHVADAPFVQTLEDRTFSPFYRKELQARAAFLLAAAQGALPRTPFGPLQPDPVLPP